MDVETMASSFALRSSDRKRRLLLRCHVGCGRRNRQRGSIGAECVNRLRLLLDSPAAVTEVMAELT